jgi:Tol biopolymer transport system component
MLGRRAGAVPGTARVVAAMALILLGIALTTASGRSSEEQKTKIVFLSTRGGDQNDDLYALDPGDGRIARLTKDSGTTDDVVVSRDGSRVAFYARGETGNPEGIEVVGTDGRGRRRVSECRVPTVSFSPDGRRLACKAQGNEIVLVDLDGSAVQRLAPDGSAPEWSPDGRLIAYVDERGLMVVEAEGGAPRRLTPRRPYRVAWSPDSTQVAVESREGLFVVRADGTGEQRLLRGELQGAAWSPDGRAIAVKRGDWCELGALTLVDVATGVARRLALASSNPSWSPGGRWIVFDRERGTNDSCDADLYVIRPDGTGLHALTGPFPDGGRNRIPQWVPGAIVDGLPRTTSAAVGLRPRRELAFRLWFDVASDLAADGSRVAAAGCVLWEVRARRVVHPRACRAGADAVAVGGTRLAWLYNWCSCNLEGYVDVRFADPPYRRQRQAVFSAHLNEGYEGEEAANLVGDGALLAFNLNTYRSGGRLLGRQLWTIPRRTQRRRQRCPESKSGLDNSSGAGRFCLRVRVGDGAAALDVDRGRLLALRDDGPLLLIRADGRLARRWRFAAREVTGAALTGSTVVVTTDGQLLVYAAGSGALRDSWQLPRGFAPPRVEDAFGGVAIYVRGGAVHLVRLRDGRDVAIHVARQAADVHARLERPGLFYLYNRMGARKLGRIAFVPRKRLAALVAGGRRLPRGT